MIYLKDILKHIDNNINLHRKIGIIAASPSNDPNYNYHWIRDSALVMRVYIDLYSKDKNDNYFKHLINYIENEYSLQDTKTISGLGEPKYNIDGSAFNDAWGRPQNDGPALRGIMMIKIFNLLKNDYPNIVLNLVSKIIEKDIIYTLNNLDNPCFDIWEEVYGYHFYTRIIQLKFIKDYIDNIKYLNQSFIINKPIHDIYEKFKFNIKDHLTSNSIISSFDENGNICKEHDSSILLAYCHIEFDEEILKTFDIKYINKNIYSLLDIFRKKYNNNTLSLVGRYPYDVYQGGHIWIICSLAMAQIYKHLKNETYKEILNYIMNIDEQLDISEQYDPINKKQISSKTLTWNYSELYFSLDYYGDVLKL